MPNPKLDYMGCSARLPQMTVGSFDTSEHPIYYMVQLTYITCIHCTLLICIGQIKGIAIFVCYKLCVSIVGWPFTFTCSVYLSSKRVYLSSKCVYLSSR